MVARRLPAQVDPTTCGIAALAVVAARTGALPGYLGAGRDHHVRVQQRLHSLAARTVLPWPQAWGTSPWALASLAGGATGYAHHLLPWGEGTLRATEEALASGRDVFLYVGGRETPVSSGADSVWGSVSRSVGGFVRGLLRGPATDPGVPTSGPAASSRPAGAGPVATDGSGIWHRLGPRAAELVGQWGLDLVPRHVVALLAGGRHAGAFTVFEPSSGMVTEVPRTVFQGSAPLPGAPFGHWSRPLFAVVPRP